ncbi:MAG: hypothetical protein IT200_04370 [Thermoleophilia bacterium]|nr:hypothetical protein [Thermoleophilia bacterium]
MSTSRHEPARPNVESHEETLHRVEEEQHEVMDRGGRDLERDPSTRAGFTWLLVGTVAAALVVGYLVTFLVVGPISGWATAVNAGFAGALVLAVIAALLLAEGEDGRIARWVGRHRHGRR